MCIYIYICIYTVYTVYVYIYICTYRQVHIHTLAYVYIHMYTCINIGAVYVLWSNHGIWVWVVQQLLIILTWATNIPY